MKQKDKSKGFLNDTPIEICKDCLICIKIQMLPDLHILSRTAQPAVKLVSEDMLTRRALFIPGLIIFEPISF